MNRTGRPVPSRLRARETTMNYTDALDAALDRLHDEGRYRTFIDIEREKGNFPHAVWTPARRHRTGHHRLVRQRLSRHGPASGGAGGDARGAGRHRRRFGRDAQHLGHHGLSQAAGGGARRPARQGSGAGLLLGLYRQRRDAVDAAQAVPRPDHLFRRAEPRLDDRGHPPQRRRPSASSATTTSPICANCWPPTIRRRRS